MATSCAHPAAQSVVPAASWSEVILLDAERDSHRYTTPTVACMLTAGRVLRLWRLPILSATAVLCLAELLLVASITGATVTSATVAVNAVAILAAMCAAGAGSLYARPRLYIPRVMLAGRAKALHVRASRYARTAHRRDVAPWRRDLIRRAAESADAAIAELDCLDRLGHAIDKSSANKAAMLASDAVAELAMLADFRDEFVEYTPIRDPAA